MRPVVISLLGVALLAIHGSAQDAKDNEPGFNHPGFETKITLELTHPGFKSKKAEKHELDVKLDPDRNPLGYAMEVKSVFCSDEKCDVITLNMLWDHLGRFVDYQLPKGIQLTKYEHEPFEKADYAKFDQLMQKRGSVLGDLDIKQLIVKQEDPEKNTKQGTKATPKDIAGKGDALQKVDAISGATPSYIQQEVIEGAAYTCYTMWHWANGNTAKQIRTHAQKQGSREWLIAMLESKDTEEIDFALEAIVRRKLSDAKIQAKLIAAAKASSMDGFKLIVGQLEATHPKREPLYAAYQELMTAADGQRRIHLLEQIAKLKQAPPINFLETNAAKLAEVENFYELQLFLKLAEKHETPSDKLLASIAKVLEHDNFFFSRRAHTFLKEHKLPAGLKTKLQAYEKKHEGHW